jgi:hypothetical protein
VTFTVRNLLDMGLRLVGFIPFFAVKELGRVIGRDTIAALFYRKRAEP